MSSDIRCSSNWLTILIMRRTPTHTSIKSSIRMTQRGPRLAICLPLLSLCPKPKKPKSPSSTSTPMMQATLLSMIVPGKRASVSMILSKRNLTALKMEKMPGVIHTNLRHSKNCKQHLGPLVRLIITKYLTTRPCSRKISMEVTNYRLRKETMDK